MSPDLSIDSHAVLIGVSAYDDADLLDIPAAANSLYAMRTLLTSPLLCGWPGDQVTVIENPEHAGKLAQQLRSIAQRTAGVLLLYFVGHGMLSPRGELCLALSDTVATDPDLTGLEYVKVKEIFRDCPAQAKVAILDCCYSGRAIEALSSTGGQVADTTDCRGVFTLTASDHAAHVVPLSQQVNARTSFTREFVDLIRTGIPGGSEWITLGELYPHLRQRLTAQGLPAPNRRGTDTVDWFRFTYNAAAEETAWEYSEASHEQSPAADNVSFAPRVSRAAEGFFASVDETLARDGPLVYERQSGTAGAWFRDLFGAFLILALGLLPLGVGAFIAERSFQPPLGFGNWIAGAMSVGILFFALLPIWFKALELVDAFFTLFEISPLIYVAAFLFGWLVSTHVGMQQFDHDMRDWLAWRI